ncbi:MAG: right-handed parallel beta-helix repeat-containing protein [Gemmatimonadales bacterium]
MSEGAAQAAGSQRTVVRVPPTIDAAGLRDVTAALQAFLDSVPDGATIEFPDSARYRAEGGLAFVNRRGLTLEGHGATILATTDGRAVPWPQGLGGSRKRWPRTRRHLLFVGGENIAVRNLVIKGAHPAGGVGEAAYVKALEAQHGFEFRGVQGVELDRVTVTDVYGDFVYLGGYAGSWTRKVHIHDSRFERNGWQGIAVTWAEDVLIERNHLGQSRRAMLDLEPHNEQGGARRIVVRNNTFGPGRLFFLASKGRGSNIEDVTIEGNRLSRALNIYVVPPSGHRRARFRIVNNVSEDRQGGPPGLFFYMGSPPALMTFERIDGLEVRGNTNRLPFAPQMIGVRASESCRVIVTANDFPGATQDSEVHPHGCP